MFSVFGPNPVPFHAVTMLLHLVNIGLVFVLARTYGVSRRTAGLGAALFGALPLLSTLLSSAVGINDELAFTLALGALLALRLNGILGFVVPGVLFALGMLCKESVILLPLLALVPPASGWNRSTLLRVRPLLAISLVFGALFVALRPRGLAPDAVVYAVQIGPNVLHNLMTYVAWSVNLRNPLPDLVSSYDPQAWRIGIWVVVGALLSLVMFGKREPAIRVGLTWFILGLLPVLPLQYQTYRHYLYPAAPGLALAVAGATLGCLQWLVRVARPPIMPASRVAGGLAMLGALAYGAMAEQLVRKRFETRVAGTDLALDPVNRRREVAERAMDSIGRYLQREQTDVAILMPEGVGRVFGARSGREYISVPAGGRPYNLLEESIDQGRAVKLFYPWIDSVAFVQHWSPAYRDFDLFLPYQNGYLRGVGSGPSAHAEAARWMMEQKWYPQARDHLRSVLEVYSQDPGLRLGYGAALLKGGDRAAAVAQLREVIRIAPGDSAAISARVILASLESDGGK